MILWSWGANSHGQLGLNVANEQVEKPTSVNIELYNNKIRQIACGGGHTLLVDSEGKLFSCGWNNSLQLATEQEVHCFERTWRLSGINFTHIACGWDSSCGITDDQFLFVWGSNSYGQLGLPQNDFPKNVKPIRLQVKACAVSMGLRHTAIINFKDEVWVTGCGRHGQLGLGKEQLSADRFSKVPKLGKISHIACGQRHTVAWSSEENALYVWGDNRHGQLLLDTQKYPKAYTPQKIDIDIKQKVKKLLTGWSNILLWLEDGTLIAWGCNIYAQLGTQQTSFSGSRTHIKLPDGRQVKDIALGSEHTICLATDNTLWAWGWNEHLNTGIKSADEEKYIGKPTLVPLEINSNSIITQIYCGGAQNFIVTEEKGDSDPVL
ncbi:secretion-regulating guanine nucleotide exchange factor [Manduca sexta]|uniref:RCC1-like domain-containing protein n=1 Tax=Manduca sexta TaxID=7130 RepID=A0A922CZX1_MANSE|nr:secretion-regulating guanine nucleotide exchange factor [Manduca sexta]KAG6463353.1 hypothetical protein O3G_MSEX013820 [Manduca sexta]